MDRIRQTSILCLLIIALLTKIVLYRFKDDLIIFCRKVQIPPLPGDTPPLWRVDHLSEMAFIDRDMKYPSSSDRSVDLHLVFPVANSELKCNF